jgi:hypothetical protein
MNGGDILVTTGTKRKWTPSKGWHSNPRYGRVFKILSLIGAAGAGAITVWNILHVDRYDDELHALEQEMKRIQSRPYDQRASGDLEKRLDLIELNSRVVSYLRHFTPDETVLDLMQLGTMYKIMGDLDLSDVE